MHKIGQVHVVRLESHTKLSWIIGSVYYVYEMIWGDDADTPRHNSQVIITFITPLFSYLLSSLFLSTPF